MDDFLILLQAKLDEAKSKGLINSDILTIQDQLEKLKLKAEIDPNSLKNIAQQLQNLSKASNGKLNIDTSQITNALNQVTKNAQQTGQQIGQQINQGMSQSFSKSENAINSFKNSLKNAGKSSSEIQSIIDKVKTLTKQIDSLRFTESTKGTMNVNVSGIDEFGNRVKITQSLVKDLKNEWNVSKTDTSIISTKEIEKINSVIADYKAKLEQFKSTNNNILSGLSAPLSEFENKLKGLKDGTISIDELKNSFKSLNAEASKITSNLSGELNKVDKAVRNISKGKETISGLKAEFKGLSNTPKEINSELTKLSTGLQNIKKIESSEGRTANWSQAYKEWQNEVDRLTAKLRVLKKEQANSASTQVFKTSDLRKSNIPYMTEVSNTIEKQMEEIQKMANAKGWQSFNVKGFEQADGLIKSLTLTVTDAEGAIKKLNFQREQLQWKGKEQAGLMQTGDIEIIKTAAQAQEELAQKTEKATAKLREQNASQANKIQLKMDTGDYEAKVESLIAKTQQWTDQSGVARISTTSLSTALNELTTASEAYANNPTEATQNRLIESSEKLDAEYKKVTNSVKKMNAEMATDSSIASLHNKVADFMSKNGKAVKYSGEFKRIFDATAQGAELTRQKVTQLNQEFNKAVVSARNAGKLGKTFFQTIREGMSSFSYWTSSTFLVMKGIQSIKSGISTVKELDTALVDLKKTTTMTASELEKFYYDSNETAKEMGVTTKEILEQASAWSRLGFSSSEQATKMAKYSSMFNLISPGMDLDSSTDGLVSVMKAFKIGLEDTDDVVDGIMSKINVIGNSKALSNSDIVEFLTRSSSAMASANNSLEETIALGEAAVEITRDASNTGQVLKTTSMRIRGYDEDVESYTEELENLKGEISDLTKTAKTPGGISLFTDETKETYKSTYKILEEISEIWDDLTDKSQANNMCLYVQKCA